MGAAERHAALRERFAAQLAAVTDLDEQRYVRRDWRERNATLRGYLLPRPPRDFLRHPAIRYQMFVDERYLAAELPYVLPRLPAAELAREDAVGDPPRVGLVGHGVTTSSNTVHHLHHLLRYAEATGRQLAGLRSVVEWGGGYGNLAKLLLRLHGGAVTYVLIDTPVFAALQWLYLAAVLGDRDVLLHTRRGVAVTPGAVNVVPVGLARDLDVEADLFVSTWALNECTPQAQRDVVERGWFGAAGLLVAMHAGDPFEPSVRRAGASAEPVGAFMPAQRYFFA